MSKLIDIAKSPAYLTTEKFLRGEDAYIQTAFGLVRCIKVEACGKYIYLYGEDGNIYYYDNSHW